MHRQVALALAPLLVLAALHPPLPGQDRIPPGSERALLLPGCTHPGHLYVPSDYKPGRSMPLILFMHGSGARPTAWPWKSATGGRGYFIVGLAYEPMAGGGLGRQGISMDHGRCREMIAHTKKVIDYMQRIYQVDRKRVFCTGLSMGGWAVDGYGITAECRGLYRGFCIIAAGPREIGLFKPEAARGLPVLILNGANDPNLGVANRGRPLLEKAGARVTQVVIPGQGHVPATPTMVEPLKSWLAGIAVADNRSAANAAIEWRQAKLQLGSRGYTDLATLLSGMDFITAAPKDRPILVFFTSTRKVGDKPDRHALDSARIEEELFSFPQSCRTPAAACHFSCFRIDVGTIDPKKRQELNWRMAPLVVLLGADRTLAATCSGGNLRDYRLMRAMRKLLSPEDQAALERRIEVIRPLLEGMRRLVKERAAKERRLARLRRTGGDRLALAIAGLEEALSQNRKAYRAFREQVGKALAK